VVLSAFLFAAGGNAVKALFKLGYSPLVLAQLRIGWAFAWLFVILLAVRPALLRVDRRELPALAVFGTIGLAGVQLSYYLTIARINIAVALLVQYLGLVAVTAFERYHRRQAVPAQVWGALAMVLIGVFFAAPPGAAQADATSRTFTRYDSPRSLPTSLTLPCAGTGRVWFSPIPVVPPSRSAVVPVRYVSKS